MLSIPCRSYVLLLSNPCQRVLGRAGRTLCTNTPERSKLPTLTLFTKQDCTLCNDAVQVLKPFSHRFNFETVDITEERNKVWHRKYRFDIPVFHLNGSFLMKHSVDLQLLHEKLQDIERNQTR